MGTISIVEGLALLLITSHCTALNPAYKLQYFCKAGWPADWIDKVCRLLTEKWQTKYKPTKPTRTDNVAGSTSTARSRVRPGCQSASAASVCPVIICECSLN